MSGGAYNIRGILFQVLRGVEVVTDLFLGDKQSTIVFEPTTGGGDHQFGVVVEQVKFRGKGAWTAREIVKEVFPNILRAVVGKAVDEEGMRRPSQAQYRLVTNAPRRDDDLGTRSGKELATWFKKRPAEWAEADSMTFEAALERVARGFEFEERSEAEMESKVLDFLRQFADSDVGADLMLGRLENLVLRLSRSGGIHCKPEELLREVGIRGRLPRSPEVRDHLRLAIGAFSKRSALAAIQTPVDLPATSDAIPKVILVGENDDLLIWHLAAFAWRADGIGQYAVTIEASTYSGALDEAARLVWRGALERDNDPSSIAAVAATLGRTGYGLWVGIHGLVPEEADRLQRWPTPPNLHLVWTASAIPHPSVPVVRVEPLKTADYLAGLANAGLDWRTLPANVRSILHHPDALSAFLRLPDAERLLPRAEYATLEGMWSLLRPLEQTQLMKLMWRCSFAFGDPPLGGRVLRTLPEREAPANVVAELHMDVGPLVRHGWMKLDPARGPVIADARHGSWAMAKEAVVRWTNEALGGEGIDRIMAATPGRDLWYVIGDLLYLGSEARLGPERLSTAVLRSYHKSSFSGQVPGIASAGGPVLWPAIEGLFPVDDQDLGILGWWAVRIVREWIDDYPHETRALGVKAICHGRSWGRKIGLCILRKLPAPGTFRRLWQMHLDAPWDQGDEGTLEAASAAAWKEPDELKGLVLFTWTRKPTSAEWFSLLHGVRQRDFERLWPIIGSAVSEIMRSSVWQWANLCSRFRLQAEVPWLEAHRDQEEYLGVLARLDPERALLWFIKPRPQPARFGGLLRRVPQQVQERLLELSPRDPNELLTMAWAVEGAAEVLGRPFVLALVDGLLHALLEEPDELHGGGYWALRVLSKVTSPEALAALREFAETDLPERLTRLKCMQPRDGSFFNQEEEAVSLLLLKMGSPALAIVINRNLLAPWPASKDGLDIAPVVPDLIDRDALMGLLENEHTWGDAMGVIGELGELDLLVEALQRHPVIHFAYLARVLHWRFPKGPSVDLNPIIERMASGGEAEVLHGLAMLGLFGKSKHLPIMRRFLDDGRPAVVDQAIRVLDLQCDHSPELLGRLEQLIAFPSAQTHLAISVLHQMRRPEARAMLRKHAEIVKRYGLEFVSPPAPPTERGIAETLHEILADDTWRGRLAPALRDLAGSSEEARQKAFEEAAFWLGRGVKDAGGLAGFLVNANPEKAISVLCGHAPKEKRRAIRREMACALGQVGNRKAAWMAIQTLLNHSEPTERIAGAELAAWLPLKAVESRLRLLWEKDEEWTVRLAAEQCHRAQLRALHLTEMLRGGRQASDARRWQIVLAVAEELKRQPWLPIGPGAWQPIWKGASPRLQDVIQSAIKGKSSLTDDRKEGLPSPTSLIFE